MVESTRPASVLAGAHLRRSLSLALACALLLAGAPVWAGSVSMTGGKVVRWAKTPVSYKLHPACSTDLNAAACLDEVRKSFNAWVGPSCSSLKFVDAGMSSNLKLTSVGFNENGSNELAWIENSVWTYGKYVLGVTSPLYYTSGKDTGVIIEADIAMNGYQQTWAMSGKTYTTDVMNVAVHEIGHFFGLQHNLQPNKANPETMAPTADPFMGSRTPEQDDIDGLCFLYPATGAFACTSSAQCPRVVDDGPSGEVYVGQIPCQNGTCAGAPTSVPSGGGKLGDACQSDANCDKPTFCQPISANQAVCSQSCIPSSSGSCPAGFGCVAYQGSTTQGACIAGAGGGGTPTGKDIGAPCASSAECKSQMCVSSGGAATCQTPCTANAQCPAGQTCQLFSGKTYGACATPPSGGGGGSKTPDGGSCTSSSQCASALCVGSGSTGTCVGDCTSKPCAAGFACVALSNGKGGCFPAGNKGLGETCSEDLDCAGGLCMADGGKYICSQPCSGSKPCPSGYGCYAVSGGSACFPEQPKAGIGATCQASSDCLSDLCVTGTSGATCSQPCSKDSQCGVGFACASLKGGGGACVELGSGTSGSPCDSPYDCQSAECVNFGKGYVCGTPCTGQVDCACGEECKSLSGESWCLAGAKKACVADLDACAAGSECVSGLCLGGKCAPSCSIFGSGASCAEGKGCIRLQDDLPEGTCSTQGPEGFGAPCGSDTTCVSLFCDKGFCGKPCNPFGPNTCPYGLVCDLSKGSVGACTTAQPVAADDAGGGDTAPAGGDTAGGGSDGTGGSSDASSGSDTAGNAGGGDGISASDTGGSIGAPIGGTSGGSSSGCSAGTAPGSRTAWPLLLVVAAAWTLVLRRRRSGAAAA